MSVWAEAVPNWLAAVGTISATGVAVWLAWGERRRADAAEDERDDLRAWRETETSRKVVGWLDWVEGEQTSLSGSPIGGHWQITVANGSDDPIRTVIANAAHYDGKTDNKDLVGFWTAIPGRDKVVDRVTETLGNFDEPPTVTIQFTDARNRTWERHEYGDLKRIS